jgi:hypothetical protein
MVDRHAAHAQVVYHHDQLSLRASVCAANGRPLLAMMPGPASSRAMARSDRPEVGSAAIALLLGFAHEAAARRDPGPVGPTPDPMDRFAVRVRCWACQSREHRVRQESRDLGHTHASPVGPPDRSLFAVFDVLMDDKEQALP